MQTFKSKSKYLLTASSNTKNLVHDRAKFPVDIRSSKRPGVPTTMSTCHFKLKSIRQ